MRKIILILLLSCSATAEPASSLNRYLMITVCFDGGECLGPVAKDLENSSVDLKFESCGGKCGKGASAVDRIRVVDEGVPFNAEIRVTRIGGLDEYYVYTMLRSGPTLKRHGKVKTFRIKDLAKFDEVRVKDEPIKFNGGTLKAELVVGPQIEVTK
jgi:hypothetical protein